MEMNHCVPEFEIEDDNSIPNRSSKGGEDELVEIVWQNGVVVLQSQNQTSLTMKKSPIRESSSTKITQQPPTALEAPYQLFTQEDEMASLLHYPLEDDFSSPGVADLLYLTPTTKFDIPPPPATVPPPRPPIPPSTRTELLADSQSSKLRNFMHVSRQSEGRGGGVEPSQPLSVRESTVVDSSDTGGRISSTGDKFGSMSSGDVAAEQERCDFTVTSSSGGSGSMMPDDRKRKSSTMDDQECRDEDGKFESDTKKQGRGSSSTRRFRASEIHNLSERRRRDRINKKMKALQELIPRCNKSDKASMLDEAIEYLKSLQLQVQMMSMGCSMVPMVFPSVQQYMSPMGMGMGMGMNMDMGMNRPMMPFPHVLAGSSMTRPASAEQLSPRLPMPTFHPPPSANGSAMQPTNQSDPTCNQMGMQGQNPLQVPSFIDPYQQYMSLYHMQPPSYPHQNQANSRPSTSKGVPGLENQKPG